MRNGKNGFLIPFFAYRKIRFEDDQMETTQLEKDNKHWSGRFGFIMAVVGSAVGLGNIWRFPYVAGQQGGAIFLFVYIVMVATIGFLLMSAEITFGRNAHANIVDAFQKRHKRWTFVGYLSILVAFLIVSYYSVIGGWITRYLGGYIIGGGFVSGGDYGGVFQDFSTHPYLPIIFNLVFLGACTFILAFGVKKGIEKVSKIMMPALFVMIVFVAVVALTMDGALEGVKFFLIPDWERITQSGGVGGIIVAAMGQAFFSLSVGIGINATYGAYLKKDINIPKNTAYICGFDTFVALVAGFAILPAVFSVGLEPNAGPGLIFGSLPAVFHQLGGFGIAVAIIFFVLILFAAITSCISLLEVMIVFVEEKFKFKRVLATLTVCGVILITSTLVSLSQCGYFGVDLLEVFDLATTNFLMPVCAILMCVYIGYVWKIRKAADELTFGFQNQNGFWVRVWEIGVKYVVPLMVFVIFIFGIVGMFTK